MAALKTADDIITDLMSDVLPDIEKTIKTGSFIPIDNKAASQGGTGNNGSAGNNAGGVPNLANAVNNKSNMQNKYLTGKENDLFENACKKIDGLHKMF